MDDVRNRPTVRIGRVRTEAPKEPEPLEPKPPALREEVVVSKRDPRREDE